MLIVNFWFYWSGIVASFTNKKFFWQKKTKKKENEVCNKDASKSLSLGVHLSTLPNNSMTLKFINVRQILKTYHKSLHF